VAKRPLISTVRCSLPVRRTTTGLRQRSPLAFALYPVARRLSELIAGVPVWQPDTSDYLDRSSRWI